MAPQLSELTVYYLMPFKLTTYSLGSRCSELVSVPTFLVHRDYQVEGIPLQRRSFLKHVTNTLVRPAQRIAGLGQIRGLKLVKSAKGKGTLDDVQASTNKATHDNVVKALEKLEEKVCSNQH